MATKQPPNCCSQCCTLVRRKDGLLKCSRVTSTICEVVLPALMCALLILGSKASETDTYPELLYAPADLPAALDTVSPLGFQRLINEYVDENPGKIPGAIPSLPLWLSYSYLLRTNAYITCPPYDGTFLAVTPDTPDVRHVVGTILNASATSDRMVQMVLSVYGVQLTALLVGSGQCSVGQPCPLAQILDNRAPVDVRYFSNEEAIEDLARDKAPLWAAVVFSSIPAGGVGQWRYALRFNFSSAPRATRKYDRFPDGLSDMPFGYYEHGFLTLQHALNAFVMNNRSVTPPDFAYGVPFPINAYSHNVTLPGFEPRLSDSNSLIPMTGVRILILARQTFFDFAGNLIGLVVVFSFLVPLSTMLRTLVLEKEARLKEELLMMGATRSSYYGSVLCVYGAAFILAALIAAAEIGSSCYTRSQGSLVVTLFVLFALATMCFTLALVPFFKNARMAALVGPLLFFGSSQLYNLFLERGELVEGRGGQKTIVSIFPTMAFYLGASLMSQYEGSQQGVSWATANDDEFGVGASLRMLVFDCFFWLFIAWYADQVTPSEYGIQRKPWFLCSPSYWCDDSSESARAGPAGSGPAPLAVEPLAAPVTTKGVKTSGLRKVWKTTGSKVRVIAVHGLDLEMEAGKITGLLGANGAGKTTTISMLTGLISPSGGDATIDGRSIRTQMNTIRHSLGVCPQVNVIFEGLTPTQHLRLYGSLKGLAGSELDGAIRAMLAKVMLAERAHTEAVSLSGGQKRKLCLAISLIGESETLFLDEPTSGMDPHSRRAIWQLLREVRAGRTIVLTTHFLDEADILSDRIAIMAEGALRCVGTALYLKEHFGTGYHLSTTKAASFSLDALLTLARRHVADAKVDSETAEEATIRLPGDDLTAFQALFAELEQRLSFVGVAAYGATCATLEDVFLQINDAALQRLASQEAGRGGGVPPIAEGDCLVTVPAGVQPGQQITLTLNGQACAVTVPPNVAEGDQFRVQPPAAGTTAVAMPGAAAAPTAHAVPITMPLPTDGGGGGGASSPLMVPPTSPAAPPGGGTNYDLYSALVVKRRISARRDCYTSCCMIFFPVVLVWMALGVLNISNRISDTGDPLVLLPGNVLKNPGQSGGRALLLPTGDAALAWQNQLSGDGWDLTEQLPTSDVPDTTFPTVLDNISTWALHNPSEGKRAALSYDAAVNLGPGLPPARIGSLLYNSTAYHVLPTLLNCLCDAMLRGGTAGAQVYSSLEASAHTLPMSNEQAANIDAFVSVSASIMILIPFAFVAATFVTPLVRERESGSKEMQFISGVKGLTYWLANWSWDLCMYLIVLVACLFVFAASGRDEFVGDATSFFGTALLLLMFGFAALPLSSAASFLFRTPSYALIMMIAFHFATGFALVLADFILDRVPSTEDANDALRNVYRFFPAYCLGNGFFSLSTRETSERVNRFLNRPPPDVFSWDMLGAPITYLVIEGLAGIALTLALQKAGSFVALQQAISCDPHKRKREVADDLPPQLQPHADGGVEMGSRTPTMSLGSLEDDSVVAERTAIDGGDASGQLVLKHLRKVYGGVGGKVAVRDLCLRIQTGECFGFLGVNGAGKSTTFSMLTGASPPTSGDAILNNMSILTDQDAIRRLVGYCPQHDALERLMTGRETLRMYAAIKKVAAHAIEAEVDGLINDLDLAKFADKPAGQYSGGNKRKLCVGIALVGSPQLVLLDEPSSGMDAASKRFLWTVIKRRTSHCCTVLTTHSMEECEALCGRIGVMVDGALRCLGPIQSLKSKYGSGYKLDLRLLTEVADEAAAQPLVSSLQAQFAGTQLEELEPPSMVLTVPSATAQLSQLFAALAELRASGKVQECSVTQCTLEQIFIMMASKARPGASNTMEA